MGYNLEGHISGDTFKSKGNSHFSDENGIVACGTKNKFGMDCSIGIKFVSYTEFYTDQSLPFNAIDKLNNRRNHLPLDCFITCKKCLKYIEKQLNKTQ